MFLGRVVEPGEPLWLDEDRQYAIGLHQYEQGLCGNCRQRLEETLASVDGKPAHRYEQDEPSVCAGCTEQRAGMRDYDDDERGYALKFPPVTRVT